MTTNGKWGRNRVSFGKYQPIKAFVIAWPQGFSPCVRNDDGSVTRGACTRGTYGEAMHTAKTMVRIAKHEQLRKRNVSVDVQQSKHDDDDDSAGMLAAVR
jgi:hypothetical protein